MARRDKYGVKNPHEARHWDGEAATQSVQSAETPTEPYVGREFVKQPDLSAVIERIVAEKCRACPFKLSGCGDCSCCREKELLRSALQEFAKEMRG
jgi:hypothetical protein